MDNNIFTGFPKNLLDKLKKKRLFAINMPHALSPFPNALPQASDGGQTGIEWTVAALQALTTLIGSGGVAVILCYSLGNAQQSRWEIVEKALQLFPPSNVRWELLKDVRIWRINGKKDQPNPMLLREGLPLKADCKLYVKDEQRDKVRQGYIQLVSFLEKEGWDVLGCGILEVNL